MTISISAQRLRNRREEDSSGRYCWSPWPFHSKCRRRSRAWSERRALPCCMHAAASSRGVSSYPWAGPPLQLLGFLSSSPFFLAVLPTLQIRPTAKPAVLKKMTGKHYIDTSTNKAHHKPHAGAHGPRGYRSVCTTSTVTLHSQHILGNSASNPPARQHEKRICGHHLRHYSKDTTTSLTAAAGQLQVTPTWRQELR